MSTYQNEYDSLFESTYLEIFHEYNPILGKDRELALRRQLGDKEPDFLFGTGDGSAEVGHGCCRGKRPYIFFGLVLVGALVAIILFFYKDIF
jgi:hypothetical protein